MGTTCRDPTNAGAIGSGGVGCGDDGVSERIRGLVVGLVPEESFGAEACQLDRKQA
jgi:hypothetical protein